MPKSKAEVVTAALYHLGVASAEEPEQAADTTRTTSIYDALWAELDGSQGLNLDTNDFIEDKLFLSTYRLLAAEIAPYYGIVPEARSKAIARLRQAALQVPIDLTVKVDYF